MTRPVEGFQTAPSERVPAGELRLVPTQIAFIEAADRLAVAGPGSQACPALVSFTGQPGMLQVIDQTTVVLALGASRDHASGSPPLVAGDACTGLIIATHSREAMRVSGAVRWLRCTDAARVVRRALRVDRRRYEEQPLLLFDIQTCEDVVRDEIRALDSETGT